MLKSYFDTEKVSVKLGMLFSHVGLSPNTWTVLAILPAVIAFIALAVYHNLFMGFLFFLAAGVIDAIDGAVAPGDEPCIRSRRVFGWSDRPLWWNSSCISVFSST